MGGTDEGAGTKGISSIPMSIMTLLKNMMGGGIFSLPIGLYYATPYTGMWIFAGIALLSSVTYWMVGYCCISWSVGSFRALWNATLGEKSAWIIDVTLWVNSGFTLVTYLVLIGDFTTKSFEGLFSPQHILATSRNLNIWTLVVLVLMPLSLQPDLRKLAFTSVLGLTFLGYAWCLVVFDAVANSPAEWSEDIKLSGWTVGAFEAIAIYTHAFVAHYNAPKIFSELVNPTQQRWSKMVFTTYFLALVIYGAFAFGGFRRFEAAVEGNILRNYASDVSALIAWLGMGFSVAFTYPIIFNAMRVSSVNLVGMMMKKPSKRSRGDTTPPQATASPWAALLSDDQKELGTRATLLLVFVTGVFATFCSDAGIVNALSGSILGCAVTFVFPSLLFFQTVKCQLEVLKKGAKGTPLLSGRSAVKLEGGKSHLFYKFGMILGVLSGIAGIVFTVIGTVVILQRAGGGH